MLELFFELRKGPFQSLVAVIAKGQASCRAAGVTDFFEVGADTGNVNGIAALVLGVASVRIKHHCDVAVVKCWGISISVVARAIKEEGKR